MSDAVCLSDAPIKSSEKSVEVRVEGNKLLKSRDHNGKVHLNVLSLYNQSVALAENDSEELALAISFRSKLLMHLRKYEEAFNDIVRSCEITKSRELKNKLLIRKKKCLLLIHESSNDKELDDTQNSTVPMIHKKSKKIPCASYYLIIKHNETYGRHIVTAEDIEPGTVIAKEKAIAVLTFEKTMYSHCSHCLMIAYNGTPCNTCTFEIYCSEKCKKEAWLHYHDVECSILSCPTPMTLTREMFRHFLFTLRLFIRLIKNEGLEGIIRATNTTEMHKANKQCIRGFFENGEFKSNKFQSFYNLSDVSKGHKLIKKYHHLCVPYYKWFINNLVEKTDILKDYKKILHNEDLMSFLEQLLDKLRRIVALNSFGIDAGFITANEKVDDLNLNHLSLGSIVTPFCSLFNHSCEHNAGRSYTKNQEICIYAVRPIKKGEQVFINYGAPIEMERDLRQEKLKFYYNFTCVCKPCLWNWPTDANFQKFLTKSKGKKLISQFREIGMTESAINAFCGYFDKVLFNETTLRNLLSMYQIIDDNFPYNKARIYFVYIKNFFNMYYLKLYNIKVSIPVSC